MFYLPMALPQPKVLNFASIMIPFSSVSNCSFITSPQAGAPTRPGNRRRRNTTSVYVDIKWYKHSLTSSHIFLLLVKTADVARVFVMINDIVMIASSGFGDSISARRTQHLSLNSV